MKKKLIIGTVLLLTIIGGYFLGKQYYTDKFTANTQFISSNIGNLTLAQAKDKVCQDLEDKTLHIQEKGQEVLTVQLKDLEPKINLDQQLEELYQQRDVTSWPLAFMKTTKAEQGLHDEVELDTDKLKGLAEEAGLGNQDRQEATPDTLAHDDKKGYYIQDGKDGTTINFDQLTESIIQAVESHQDTIQLEDNYTTHLDVTDTETLEAKLAKINNYKDLKITYLLAGDEVTIPNDKLVEWVSLDDQGEIVVDEEALVPYLDSLNENYSTFGTVREFESTYQGTVEVPPGILGWQIDTELELPELEADILAGKDVKRKPEIYSTGDNGGEANEFGDTYIEIDLTYQTMLLYVDGELIVETGIVSGMPGTDTVPGADAVNEMLANTDLIGYNPRLKVEYSVPVNYWIRFDDNAQGIHDASWQGAYGGDVFTYAGSLGCINTPYDAVATIFQYVNVGTPVVVFY